MYKINNIHSTVVDVLIFFPKPVRAMDRKLTPRGITASAHCTQAGRKVRAFLSFYDVVDGSWCEAVKSSCTPHPPPPTGKLGIHPEASVCGCFARCWFRRIFSLLPVLGILLYGRQRKGVRHRNTFRSRRARLLHVSETFGRATNFIPAAAGVER